jgi:type I restriction enzyme M protein
MDYERTRPPYNKESSIPAEYNWASLLELDGIPLERHYRIALENLGKEPGILGIIFRKAQNKIQNPAHLRRLIVDLIDKEPWNALSADVKGDIYEGLLEKNAQDTKSGAGQYFTPRVLIDAIVEAMRPQPGNTIIDPAAGTGGFLLAAASYIINQPSQARSRPAPASANWSALRRRAGRRDSPPVRHEPPPPRARQRKEHRGRQG